MKFPKPVKIKKKPKGLRKHSARPIAKLKKEAWRVFSLFIRNRDNWTCYTCGSRIKGAGMHAGHFISRTKLSTFFDEMNVHAQCYPCNIFKKGNAGEYSYRLVEQYGPAEFYRLLERGRSLKPMGFTRQELENIITKYAL